MASYNCTNHGKYPKRTEGADVDQEKTNKWLKKIGLKAEIEGLIMASHDQNLATISYHYCIIKDGTDPQCRIWSNHKLHLKLELPKPEHSYQHNKAATYMQWKICIEHKFRTADKWYEHQCKTVTENDELIILWIYFYYSPCLLSWESWGREKEATRDSYRVWAASRWGQSCRRYCSTVRTTTPSAFLPYSHTTCQK